MIELEDVPERRSAPMPKMTDLPPKRTAAPIKTSPTKYTPPVYAPRPVVATLHERLDTLKSSAEAYAAAAAAIGRADALSHTQKLAVQQVLSVVDAASATLRTAIAARSEEGDGTEVQEANA
jgi:hypothetical protein